MHILYDYAGRTHTSATQGPFSVNRNASMLGAFTAYALENPVRDQEYNFVYELSNCFLT